MTNLKILKINSEKISNKECQSKGNNIRKVRILNLTSKKLLIKNVNINAENCEIVNDGVLVKVDEKGKEK